MFKIETICQQTSNYIAQELNFDSDKKSVINYGIFAFIQMSISIALVIIFGFIFKATIEALLVSFTISILRKSSGGVHSQTAERCVIIGTVSSVGMALISKHINISVELFTLLVLITFIWSYYTVYKLAPVDSIAKPIKNIVKRRRLKRSSLIVLSVYLLIEVINIVYYSITNDYNILIYSMCICMGLLWQVFSLTNSGHLILGKLG